MGGSDEIVGTTTRTFISSAGVTFTPGDVCVFEGLVHVQYLAKRWYAAHLSTGLEGEKVRQADKTAQANTGDYLSANSPFASSHIQDQLALLDLDHDDYNNDSTPPRRPNPRETFSYGEGGEVGDDELPAGLKIVSCDPIVERRSTFIGHAVRVTSEKHVPLVIHELLSDKKIAKAAHPAIFAYRIAKEIGGPAGKVISSGKSHHLSYVSCVLIVDCDDDGESAAGGRLAHLLEILELENVLVVVSRWYGGTLLGPDRFKLINQAARDALEKAGFLDDDKHDNKSRRRK
jgi:putative IMPACT (imprinted ancient) family translation regulator